MKKYLMIDDVRSARTLLCEILDSEGGINAEGYTLDVARTYDEGYLLLSKSLDIEQPYDLLLLDHDLGNGPTGLSLLYAMLNRCYGKNGEVLQHRFNSLPKRIKCVSSNPPGRASIESLVDVINKERENLK